MTSKNFLIWGGWTLLVLGILGFIFPDVGGNYLIFTAIENWAHILFGLVALAVGYVVKDFFTLKIISGAFGIIGLIIGIWGFIVVGNPSPNFYNITDLNQPINNAIHLIIAVWALWSAFSRR